ncbi:MAG: thioredoxin family protein [Deltaproteobacteria bacterium]|nr:thioredoxin family protein [Deltaproteobacteria bacterium]MBW2615302.1 thioredoxin family protein [Deltaproteobacteria bacterium]
MKKAIFPIIALFLMVSGGTAMAATGSEWMEDFKAAKARAILEGKDMLLNFSGSDWCGWCIKLKQEVFSKASFKNEATKNFILVELDLPQRTKQPARIKEQNQKLVRAYGVMGFPTILVTDAKGRVYARAGYMAGGPEKFISYLEKVRKSKVEGDALIARAEKAQGLKKARLLDQAVERMADSQMEIDPEIIDQIKKLDKDNKAGLKAKYEVREGLGKIMQETGQSGDYDKALKDIDGLIASVKPGPRLKQYIYFVKAKICLLGKKDKSAGIENLKTAEKIAPNTEEGKQLSEMIKKLEAME